MLKLSLQPLRRAPRVSSLGHVGPVLGVAGAITADHDTLSARGFTGGLSLHALAPSTADALNDAAHWLEDATSLAVLR